MIKCFKLLDSVAILKPVSNTRLTLVEPEYGSIEILVLHYELAVA
ncbi:hypothetical protein OSCI_3280021 [Kamptonema sp. PCC 6506]|nr:hypothetical protein OSCI_3280021 [Kamptonema sp. PCC 6506]